MTSNLCPRHTRDRRAYRVTIGFVFGLLAIAISVAADGGWAAAILLGLAAVILLADASKRDLRIETETRKCPRCIPGAHNSPKRTNR